MSGDHKRKSRPIAPAEVRVGDGWFEVVVPDVLGKNESHKAGRHLSQATKRLRESVRLGVAVLVEKARRGWPVPVWATSGPWRAEVLGVWPRKRGKIEGRDIDFEAPVGDADAPVAQAFDALKHAGAIDDDARVVEVRAWNLYRKDVRCTVIRLVRVSECFAERDAQIAHLVARVPASPEPAAKPAPKQRRLRGLPKPRKETPCTTTTSSS